MGQQLGIRAWVSIDQETREGDGFQKKEMASTSSRYNVEKFNGNNNFSLWKIKIEALLGNLSLEEALKEEKEMSKTLMAEQK